MSSKKIFIEKNSVQETLIIPLYGRKLCSEKFPELYMDDFAKKNCVKGWIMIFLNWRNLIIIFCMNSALSKLQ